MVYFNKSCAKNHTSNDTRGAIIAFYKCGKSQRYIAKQLNIARSTVQLWVSRSEKFERAGKSCPRPHVLGGLKRQINLLMNW